MALSEEEKVTRDAGFIAKKVSDLEEGDDYRVFDADGRDPKALAKSLRELVGTSWEVSVVHGRSIELKRIYHLTPEDGEIDLD